jgi:membrane associated rhomboid family serine protease
MGRVNKLLIGANLLVFLLQNAASDGLLDTWALWPLGRFASPETGTAVGFHVWQLVTSAFLHGSPAHLALNMFALWMFGRDVEVRLGDKRYALLYGAAVLTASLTQLVSVSLSGETYPTVGASGGVFGILLAFGVMFPERRVMLLFPPIPMPARVFVVLYGALELAHGVFGTAQGVAHFAHLGGMLGAGILLFVWRRPPRPQTLA